MKNALAILLALFATTMLAQNIGFIERKPVEVEIEGENWKFSRDYNLATAKDDALKEISPTGRFLTHSKFKNITGFNGDILIRLSMPSSIETLKAYGEITNYADSTKRHFMLSYSLDGMNFTPLSDKPEGSGTCRLEGEITLPQNRGIVYIKYQRILDEKDANGKHGFVLWGKLGFSLGGKSGVKAEEPAKKTKHLKEVFPTGVFWAWERTQPCADYAKMELWAFVDKTMKMLKENGYDTLWFVNIGKENMLKLLPIAEANDMQVLFNTDLLTTVYNGTNSMKSLETHAWNTYKSIGSSPALLGYILKDEPQFFETENMSTFYDLMKEVDPDRDSISTCMNRQSLTYLRDSSLPVVCSDIYYFGSENSTQLPTPEYSQAEFTLLLSCFGKSAAVHNKHTWFMGQMFGDVWGRHWRKGDKLVVEPGSYLHWKAPTDAECRWQIWEALRLGTKGVLFYVLFPPIQLEVSPSEAKDEWQQKRIARMDKAAATAAGWKDQKLVSKQIELDPCEGMTEMDGSPTHQLLATAPIMKLLRKHEQLLLKRNFAKVPVFYSGDNKTNTMTFTSDGHQIGVIVNRDLLNKRTAKVLLPPNAKSVTNLATGAAIPLKAVSESFQELTIDLDAGDGALLEAKFDGRPGLLLLKEDFARNSLFRLSIGKNARIECIESMGADFKHAVTLNDKDADKSIPACTLPRLTSSKTRNTISFNMNHTKQDGIIYCQINGSLKGCKVRAVTDEIGGAKENFMHLKTAEAYDVGTSGEGFVIQDKEFFRPVVVPVGTTALEFYLNSTNNNITDVTLWFIPIDK